MGEFIFNHKLGLHATKIKGHNSSRYFNQFREIKIKANLTNCGDRFQLKPDSYC